MVARAKGAAGPVPLSAARRGDRGRRAPMAGAGERHGRAHGVRGFDARPVSPRQNNSTPILRDFMNHAAAEAAGERAHADVARGCRRVNAPIVRQRRRQRLEEGGRPSIFCRTWSSSCNSSIRISCGDLAELIACPTTSSSPWIIVTTVSSSRPRRPASRRSAPDGRFGSAIDCADF